MKYCPPHICGLDVFESSARLKMLLSMYKEPCNKSDLRRLVNPKPVYENLAILQERMLIEELSDGRFDLTEMGKKILRQYLQFLNNLRRPCGRSSDFGSAETCQ